MKLRSLLAITAIAALTLVSILPAAAQGGGGGGQGGGQRQGRGGARGPQTPIGLLRAPDVKKELNLTDDETTKLTALQTDMQEKQRAAFQNAGQGGDRAAMMAEMQKMNADYETAVKAVITPAQYDRLLQIYIQMVPMAITNPEVQAKIGLSADKAAKIKSLQEAQMKANAEIQTKVRNQEIERADAQSLMQKNAEALKTEIDKVLSDDDKAKLKAAGGAPFTGTITAPRGGGRGGN